MAVNGRILQFLGPEKPLTMPAPSNYAGASTLTKEPSGSNVKSGSFSGYFRACSTVGATLLSNVAGRLIRTPNPAAGARWIRKRHKARRIVPKRQSFSTAIWPDLPRARGGKLLRRLRYCHEPQPVDGFHPCRCHYQKAASGC